MSEFLRLRKDFSVFGISSAKVFGEHMNNAPTRMFTIKLPFNLRSSWKVGPIGKILAAGGH